MGLLGAEGKALNLKGFGPRRLHPALPLEPNMLVAVQQGGILPAPLTVVRGVTGHYPSQLHMTPLWRAQGRARAGSRGGPGWFLNEVAYWEIRLPRSSYRAAVLMTLASPGPEKIWSPWGLRGSHLGCGLSLTS